MQKYEVIRPWHGVKSGDVVELATLHPALESNVRLLVGEVTGELSPATPEATSGKRGRPKADTTE
ncbi:glycoprotein [Pectobacterium zantedeschiae]|uniref:glycoprotein n=1 Tax=Pectobacterium zantedeschiae TaxID=2034769 RepID=UPI0032EB4475